MNVKRYIMTRLGEGALHMTLIDPASQEPEKAGAIASVAEGVGTDAIMVGGSTGVTQENLDATVLAIKGRARVPVIYFPSGAHAISSHCDAMYFMSMLNSRNIRHVIGEQVAGAPAVKKLGLETIAMGYLIIEPGMKVGEVGEAQVVPRNDIDTAVAYGLAAEYLGMDFMYLEAGSGAPEPVSPVMVEAMKRNLSIPVLVGGGIRRADQAREVKRAGADIIVTGTVVENGNFASQLKDIIGAIRRG